VSIGHQLVVNKPVLDWQDSQITKCMTYTTVVIISDLDKIWGNKPDISDFESSVITKWTYTTVVIISDLDKIWGNKPDISDFESSGFSSLSKLQVKYI
jgi:hypothetical protein